MLKYQVRSRRLYSKYQGKTSRSNSLSSPSHSLDKPSSSSSLSLEETIHICDRSNSLSSLSSVDSSDASEWGTLRIYTGNIKEDTDYKTLKISTNHTVKNIVDTILAKFRICKDPNLFEIIMEVWTRYNGEQVKTPLLLPQEARPLELQRCHPVHMSRFLITMSTNGVLVRIYDYLLSPKSTYKSLFISPRTTCYEAIIMVLTMCQQPGPPTDFRLYLSETGNDLNMNDTLADLYLVLPKDQKIIIRSVS
uniref:Ras-associating domain-containing protein n=1 Tax=Elaeophora elaphi TaxID=1147741 RepID=A0A0R3RKP9_9BILA